MESVIMESVVMESVMMECVLREPVMRESVVMESVMMESMAQFLCSHFLKRNRSRGGFCWSPSHSHHWSERGEAHWPGCSLGVLTTAGCVPYQHLISSIGFLSSSQI
ncbi:hypothetical protein E5288_WYG017874 [Bos mutus]|uniref:Uncharacterized protein n=1 Tax=Bos mutus TaxID=72004 RepID=A0A6B0S376_9CETA|nr:hypothetical protein [Bos mutus]